MAVATGFRRLVPSVSRPYPILALVSSAHGVTHMYAALLPLVYPMLLTQFGISYSELGLVLGVSSALGGILQFVFGVAGRYVPHRVLIGLGNLLCGLSVASMGFMSSFLQFAGLRFMLQIANSPQHPIGNSMITSRFAPAKRGSALSIHVAGGNLGTILVPVLGTFLISRLGWQPALVIFGIPGLVVGATIMMTVTEKKEHLAHEVEQGKVTADIGSFFRNRTIVLITLSSLAAAGGRGLGVILTYIPLYLKNGLHLGNEVVGALFTVLLVGGVIGPVLGGRASDIMGRKRSILVSLALSFLFTFGLIASSTNVILLATALILMGLVVYGQGPMMQTYLADVVPPANRDTTFGVFFAITFGAGAAWTAAVGALIDHFGFEAAFLVIAASYVVTFLLLLPAQECRLENKSEN